MKYECPCGFETFWHASFANHTRECEHPGIRRTPEERFDTAVCCDSAMVWLMGSPAEFVRAFLETGAASIRIDQIEGRSATNDYGIIWHAIDHDLALDAHVSLTEGKVILVRGRREKKVYRPRSGS